MRPAERFNEGTVLHVDMDSFFVSVELLDKPELIGKPVAVAHDSHRSVVSSASYEARKFGVRSAMPVSRAKSLCPSLVLVPPNMAAYKKISAEIMIIFESVTPLVEQLSIDEAFLEVSGAIKLLGSPVQIAKLIRKRLRAELGLPASVGVANTKFVAKLASERAKPNGLLLIKPEDTIYFLHSLPVADMWGVGKVTAKLLKARAIHTVKDLANEPVELLEKIVGKTAAKKLSDLSRGIDERAVTPSIKEKSVGHESTFETDISGQKDIEKELLRLSWRVAQRLREANFEAKTVSIKVRFANFETLTRSRTLQEPTNSSERFYTVARELYDGLKSWGKPVRLIGVRAEQLGATGGASNALWSDDEKLKAVDHAVDQVRERFGAAEIKPATLM